MFGTLAILASFKHIYRFSFGKCTLVVRFKPILGTMLLGLMRRLKVDANVTTIPTYLL